MRVAATSTPWRRQRRQRAEARPNPPRQASAEASTCDAAGDGVELPVAFGFEPFEALLPGPAVTLELLALDDGELADRRRTGERWGRVAARARSTYAQGMWGRFGGTRYLSCAATALAVGVAVAVMSIAIAEASPTKADADELCIGPGGVFVGCGQPGQGPVAPGGLPSRSSTSGARTTTPPVAAPSAEPDTSPVSGHAVLAGGTRPGDGSTLGYVGFPALALVLLVVLGFGAFFLRRDGGAHYRRRRRAAHSRRTGPTPPSPQSGQNQRQLLTLRRKQ